MAKFVTIILFFVTTLFAHTSSAHKLLTEDGPLVVRGFLCDTEEQITHVAKAWDGANTIEILAAVNRNERVCDYGRFVVEVDEPLTTSIRTIEGLARVVRVYLHATITPHGILTPETPPVKHVVILVTEA